jgi:hypothetical protein
MEGMTATDTVDECGCGIGGIDFAVRHRHEQDI